MLCGMAVSPRRERGPAISTVIASAGHARPDRASRRADDARRPDLRLLPAVEDHREPVAVAPTARWPAAIAAAASAGAALALFVLWAEVWGVAASTAAYAAGATPSVALGLAVGWLVHERRRARTGHGRHAGDPSAAVLRERDETFRQIVDTAHDAIWTMDVGARVHFLNDAGTRILGYGPGELVGRRFGDLIVPADRPRARTAWDRVRAGDRVTALALGLRHRDGHEVHVLVSAAPRLDAGGHVTAITGIATNLSEHRRVEEDAARQRELVRRVLQCSVDGILAFDRDLEITAWNAGLAEIFGVTAADAIGRDVCDVLPCMLENGEHEGFAATLRGDAPASTARPFHVLESGRHGQIDCHYTPLRDEAGQISGGLVVVRDRTRTQDVALALRDANELFTEVFEQAPTGMALIELHAEHGGSFLRVNRALCEITGQTAADLMSATVLDITDPDDAPADLALTRRLLAGELPRFRLEKRFRRPDGSPAWAAVSVALLRSAAGTSHHAIVQVEDVTAVRQSAERRRPASDDGSGTRPCSRARFDAELRRQVADAARHGHRGAVVMLDLENVGEISDTLGAGAGEDVVRDVAALLRNRLRETDVVALLGPDEFAVLLRLAPLDTAVGVATELVSQIGERIVAGGGARRVAVTASAGVAPIDEDAGEPHDVLARANVARHEARVAGRGQIAVYRDGRPGDLV
jgi:diguanylate cyclase (GGDEF)-like protein/PAS domain S-box-containing protein